MGQSQSHLLWQAACLVFAKYKIRCVNAFCLINIMVSKSRQYLDKTIWLHKIIFTLPCPQKETILKFDIGKNLMYIRYGASRFHGSWFSRLTIARNHQPQQFTCYSHILCDGSSRKCETNTENLLWVNLADAACYHQGFCIFSPLDDAIGWRWPLAPSLLFMALAAAWDEREKPRPRMIDIFSSKTLSLPHSLCLMTPLQIKKSTSWIWPRGLQNTNIVRMEEKVKQMVLNLIFFCCYIKWIWSPWLFCSTSIAAKATLSFQTNTFKNNWWLSDQFLGMTGS